MYTYIPKFSICIYVCMYVYYIYIYIYITSEQEYNRRQTTCADIARMWTELCDAVCVDMSCVGDILQLVVSSMRMHKIISLTCDFHVGWRPCLTF